jgi:hypothetical protein
LNNQLFKVDQPGSMDLLYSVIEYISYYGTVLDYSFLPTPIAMGNVTIARILKFTLFYILLSIVMLVSWSVGSLLGNVVTQSNPPAINDPSTPLVFLFVCLFNSLLVGILIWATRDYPSTIRWIVIVLFSFVTQFFLPQMETYFFSDSLGIGSAQIASIVMAGLIMVVVTITLGILLSDKMIKTPARTPIKFTLTTRASVILPLILMTCLVYPLIYMLFGYYIAWQSEALRLFYTQSSEIKPLLNQLTDSIFNGIYAFQILRGTIWFMVSIPLVLMLQSVGQFRHLLFGLLVGLLPATQLFIPNPYMPSDIAMTHFIETSISNFLWGVLISVVVSKYFQADTFKNGITTLG